ncbi:MAG: phosphate ABC transporter ATP-binding protein [Desulfovibrio sp.]|jgi:phosphate transport system ATP-binding protein|nr:phosphate ABC transporter ATP-binding protein [Desulfovibrio sp.]
MSATVSISDLSVSFFSRKALCNVSAFFPSGAISVLIGRSGSGKTTLLRAINRLNEEFPGCVTTGSVRLDFGEGEFDIYGESRQQERALSALRLRAGMLFQAPNCFPVSVYRNIAMPLSLAGGAPSAKIPEIARSSLEAVGLWNEVKDRLDSPAERLSGGQQQRLCLARVLALRPAILLLDEPTASLDVHAAGEIEELLTGLAARYTIIMVSHELRQARRVADRTLICDGGRIVGLVEDNAGLDEDTLAEFLHSPHDPLL